jgi:ubiquinone/menaquinone biosynthesis C-methylase UbiE
MSAWDRIWKKEEERKEWLQPEPFLVSLIPHFKEAGIKKVLDLGFGLGRHSIELAKQGFEVHGLDFSPTGLDYAKKWANKESLEIHFQLGQMLQLPYPDNFFDLIITWNVIYHGLREEVWRSMREIKRCLKNRGYLACSLISTNHLRHGEGDEIEKNTFIIRGDKEKSVPHHYFDKQEINKLLEGFTLLICEEREQFFSQDVHWHIFAANFL